MSRHAGRGVQRRRWTVLALGLVVTCVALVLASRQPGVHWARSEVSFSPPPQLGGWSGELGPDASVVPFAAVVQRAITDPGQQTFSSDEAPLHGVVTHGTSVRLANDGGQWVNAFNRPTLIVEVVDPDPDRANAMLAEMEEQIVEVAVALQDDEAVPSSGRITASVDQTELVHATASRSDLARAWVVIVGAGGIMTLATAQAVASAPAGRRGGVRGG